VTAWMSEPYITDNRPSHPPSTVPEPHGRKVGKPLKCHLRAHSRETGFGEVSMKFGTCVSAI
jgi:hypothetical protein